MTRTGSDPRLDRVRESAWRWVQLLIPALLAAIGGALGGWQSLRGEVQEIRSAQVRVDQRLSSIQRTVGRLETDGSSTGRTQVSIRLELATLRVRVVTLEARVERLERSGSRRRGR